MNILSTLLAGLIAATGLAGAGGLTAPPGAPPEPAAAPTAPPTGETPAVPDVPLFGEWRTLTTADGLPGDKILYVRAAEDAVWVGTEHGLARLEGDRVVRVVGPEDGLGHRVVLGIAPDDDGGVWVATAGGLSHVSGERVDNYDQFVSGLPNDVVFGVAYCGRDVWAATTSGLGRYDTWKDSWLVYDEKNAPMHEIWGYFVTCAHPRYVYAAVWGGGVLEYDPERDHWKDYTDPDGEMEIDLFRNDGLIHAITTSVDWSEGILWAATYFGLSTYDGRDWRGYMDHDSGLAGNFVNHARAVGNAAWLSTDRGLSWFDRKTWVTYTRKDDGAGRIRIGFGPTATFVETKTAIAHDFVFAVDQRGDDLWVATGKGLSHGRRIDARAATR